jgi:hypothetical protein
MAKVPSLPSNGQPIDTQYIYDIVSSLISINNELATNGNSNIKIGNTKYPTSKTSSLNFDAQTVNVINAKKVTKSTAETGQIAFTTAFTKTPVVTATLVSKSTTTVKANVTITAVDTTAVYYKINFDSDGTTTLDLNIIAIGV